MIRRSVASALVLAACLIGAMASEATATTTATAPPKVIRLLSITTADRSVDVKPKGRSAGDHENFASRLLNRQVQFGRKKGAVVGSDSGSVRLTKKMVPWFVTVAQLPGGTIRTQGTLKPLANGAYRIAVVGGTGVFDGVRGSLTILAPITPKTAVNVYRLIYPLVA